MATAKIYVSHTLVMDANSGWTEYDNEVSIGESDINSDKHRSLEIFDFSSIPAGSTITSVTYSCTKNIDRADKTCQFRIYRLTSSWNASTVWNTQPTYDSSVLWSYNIPNNIATGTELSGTFDLATVKGWHNGTIANYGIMLKSIDENNDLNSINGIGTTYLEITYYPPGGSFIFNLL